MKEVTVTLKLKFETEEVDDETLKESLHSTLEEGIENDELFDKAKISIKDLDDEEDEDFEENYQEDDED